MTDIIIKQYSGGTATSATYQEFIPKASSSLTLVSSQVSSYFNLNNANINDVLEWIGQYNLYWWAGTKPEKYGYIEKQTDMLGESGQAYYKWYYNNSPYTIQYSKEIEINQDTGKVQLKNPIEFTATKYNSFYGDEPNQVLQEFANLLPCYVTNLYKSTYTTQIGSLSTDIIYLPSNSTWAFGGKNGSYQKTFTGSNNNYASEHTFYIYDVSTTTVPAKRISSEFKKISEAGESFYVYSENKNTYPQERFKEDIYYSYLGQPFQKFPGVTSIITGSYVGTNTYGPDNKNTLFFNSKPKFILIIGANNDSNLDNDTGVYGNGFFSSFAHNTISSRDCVLSVNLISDYNNNIFSWWVNSSTGGFAHGQLNDSREYRYIAFL